jgi:hypothetical protein
MGFFSEFMRAFSAFARFLDLVEDMLCLGHFYIAQLLR